MHYTRSSAKCIIKNTMRAGERAAWRGAGAVVYSLEGDPEREDWGRPQFIARLGDVPEIGF